MLSVMFETTPPSPPPPPKAEGFDAEGGAAGDTVTGAFQVELEDPIAAVVAVDLSRLFVGLCLSWAEPMVADLAARESMLRKAGGSALVERLLAQRFYRRIEPHVLRMLDTCVTLEHAEAALARLEDVLRARFSEVVRTATSYLLSHDRDCAIQMVAVSTTMAARDVRTDVSDILAARRRGGGNAEG